MGFKYKYTCNRVLYIMCFVLIIRYSCAFYESYVYEIVPENSNIEMRCVLENVEFARAITYKAESDMCEKLPVSWNKNQTFESDFVYIWMKWYDILFSKKMTTTATFPNNFNDDCGLEIVVETTDVIQDGFIVNIEDTERSILFVHLSVRPTVNEAVLNTLNNGTWLDEIIAPLDGFANSTNTFYTATFFLRSTHWEVYADDVFLNNFTHVHTFDGTATVKCKSNDMFCNRVIFYGP